MEFSSPDNHPMRFTNRAYKYLDKMSRDKNFIVSNSQSVIDYMTNHGITPFDKIVEFQMDFSGLELTITHKPSSTFNATLFSKLDIEKDSPIDAMEIGGQLYFDCGSHAAAQFWFVISDSGQICTYDNKDQIVNIISSSFYKFIEGYAIEELFKEKKYEHPYFYNLEDKDSFEALTQNFNQHFSASDDYNQWLSDENIIIHKGTWLDRPTFFLHIYGNTNTYCEDFVQLLKDKKIVS